MKQITDYFQRYLAAYQPYKTYWNYEDGCVLKGCLDLYEATGKCRYVDFVLSYLNKFVSPQGEIVNYELEQYNIDSINSGKALFLAYDLTRDERYRKAADFLTARLQKHPRCACGNFWHKEIYPEQIWLDGLYMAQPFRAEYDRRFGGMREAGDVTEQFQNVRKYLFDDQKRLYYHACDLAKKQPWANKDTGKSPNFWLRSMGWYLMALADCIDQMERAGDGHRLILRDLFQEAVDGLLKYQDAGTGLFYQVIDRADVEGNYLETSGSAMVLYALMKGVRLNVLSRDAYLANARKAFESLTELKLTQDADGVWRLHDICKVAGLGPGEKRDGSVAYYLSEPRVADDSKGVGPYMMACAEYARG